MNTKTPFIILSAELSTLNSDENHTRTVRLQGMIEDLGVKHYAANGMYKGTKEVSFFCIPNNSEEMETLRDFALNNFNQESVLIQDSAGICYLEYVDNSIDRLGQMIEVDSIENLDAYTEINGKYYVVR